MRAGVERHVLNGKPSKLNTPSGNAALIGLIRAEIARRGPVSFAWFMQQALYHPEHGYYSSGKCAIGRRGDYFTNVSVGPLFGRLIAAQFVEIWKQIGYPGGFSVIEQGAHHGEFARDLLQATQEHWPEFFSALRYRIVEPFSILRRRQSETLKAYHDKVQWHDAIDALEPFIGVHFSNELLDAMPVRLIAGGTEKLIGFEGHKFTVVEEPLGESETFNRAALEWVEDVAKKLQRGFVLSIDYGRAQPAASITVQARAGHQCLNSPFEQIGYADITAHVDWTSIAQGAKTHGLRVAGFTDQHHFFSGIISRWPELVRASDQKTRRALQTLLHPEMLGRSFQVLALSKSVDPPTTLSGFKFARDSGQISMI